MLTITSIQTVFLFICMYRTLYWADMQGAIYRSSVVRPHRETLVGDNVVWPNALAIDFTGKRGFKDDMNTSVMDLSILE